MRNPVRLGAEIAPAMFARVRGELDARAPCGELVGQRPVHLIPFAVGATGADAKYPLVLGAYPGSLPKGLSHWAR